MSNEKLNSEVFKYNLDIPAEQIISLRKGMTLEHADKVSILSEKEASSLNRKNLSLSAKLHFYFKNKKWRILDLPVLVLFAYIIFADLDKHELPTSFKILIATIFFIYFSFYRFFIYKEIKLPYSKFNIDGENKYYLANILYCIFYSRFLYVDKYHIQSAIEAEFSFNELNSKLTLNEFYSNPEYNPFLYKKICDNIIEKSKGILSESYIHPSEYQSNEILNYIYLEQANICFKQKILQDTIIHQENSIKRSWAIALILVCIFNYLHYTPHWSIYFIFCIDAILKTFFYCLKIFDEKKALRLLDTTLFERKNYFGQLPVEQQNTQVLLANFYFYMTHHRHDNYLPFRDYLLKQFELQDKKSAMELFYSLQSHFDNAERYWRLYLIEIQGKNVAGLVI